MADFKKAYDILKGNEGGYANVPGDTGGVTYAGITYKNYPGWSGWPIVFSKERRHDERIPELAKQVAEFYKAEFWDKVQGDKIEDQSYAYDLFDQAVNSGIRAAIRIAQSAIGSDVTGEFSKTDIDKINGYV